MVVEIEHDKIVVAASREQSQIKLRPNIGHIVI